MIEEKLIRDELLELLLEGKLNNKQKAKIIELLEQDKYITENEMERFSLLYGLNTNGKKTFTFKQIAKIYNCSDSAIRCSVSSMKRKLLKYTDSKENTIIKNIVKECKEKDTQWKEN